MTYLLIVLGGLITLVGVGASPICDPKVSTFQSIVSAVVAGSGVSVFFAGIVLGLN